MGKQSENNLEHFPLVDTFYIDLQLFKIRKAFRRSSEWFAAVSRRKVFCLSKNEPKMESAESCLYIGKMEPEMRNDSLNRKKR